MIPFGGRGPHYTGDDPWRSIILPTVIIVATIVGALLVARWLL